MFKIHDSCEFYDTRLPDEPEPEPGTTAGAIAGTDSDDEPDAEPGAAAVAAAADGRLKKWASVFSTQSSSDQLSGSSNSR